MQAAAPGTDVREIETARMRVPLQLSARTRGASRGWWWGMLGHVRSSRQPVALAAPQAAGLSADPHSDASTSRLHHILPLPDMGLVANARFRDSVRSRLADSRLLPDVGMFADGRPDNSTHRLTDAATEPHMCLTACTRQQSGRVHPRPVTPTRHVTERSRPPAREACIQAGLSATRTPCIQAGLSATRTPRSARLGVCIQPSLSARRACIQGGFFSAREACIQTTVSAREACIQTSLSARAKCPEWGKACIQSAFFSARAKCPAKSPQGEWGKACIPTGCPSARAKCPAKSPQGEWGKACIQTSLSPRYARQPTPMRRPQTTFTERPDYPATPSCLTWRKPPS